MSFPFHSVQGNVDIIVHRNCTVDVVDITDLVKKMVKYSFESNNICLIMLKMGYVTPPAS